MTSITLSDIQRTARDTFYVSVGLGVIAFQKAQVQRHELTKAVESNLDTVEAQVDAVLDGVEAQLPEQARTVMAQARKAAKDTRTQVQGIVGSS